MRRNALEVTIAMVFKIVVTTCGACGGSMKRISAITMPLYNVVIYIGTKGPSFRSKRLEPLLPSFLTLRCHVLDAQMPA
jgi:hypothetical protein